MSEFEESRVPESVELLGCVVVLKREFVTTSVSLREFVINSAQAVKRLVDITNIMDKESQDELFSFFFIVAVFHDG